MLSAVGGRVCTHTISYIPLVGAAARCMVAWTYEDFAMPSMTLYLAAVSHLVMVAAQTGLGLVCIIEIFNCTHSAIGVHV